ncbi:MAG: DUF2334 domain-containing protein [Bacteroidales bacterium]|jgi:peptidoglycan/xylan/chitin deacetylase (PgdA/CDA1 family)|nr:DUF2334 domain-containing protein [Bacteroidales bacterium]
MKKNICLFFLLISINTLFAAPYIILKFDDLGVRDSICTCKKTLDYLKQKKIKASFGIIANRLDETAFITLQPYLEAVNDRNEVLFEMWHHGLDHKKPEFQGTSYVYQKDHFEQAAQKINKLLGITLRTFGTPYNASDTITNRVISENADFHVFMFASVLPTSVSGIKYLNNRVNIENGTGNISFSYFLDNYQSAKNKYTDYMILQAHPNGWDQLKIDELDKIINFLLSEGAGFILPDEYGLLL